MEIYKEIPGFEGLYEVSNLGNIKNIKTSKVFAQSVNSKGYVQICLQKNKKQVSMKVHRLVALAFIPVTDSNKNQINHIDGNKLNNHISNLEWVTCKENIIHAHKTGLNNVSINCRNKSIEASNKIVLDTLTGIYYTSCAEAAKIFKLPFSTLNAMLNNRNKNKTNLRYV
jgi:hypothetical protein